MMTRKPTFLVLIAATMSVLGAASVCAQSTAPVVNMSAAAPYGKAIEDQAIYTHVILNEFEDRFGSGNHNFHWSGEAWTGTDKNRLWLKSEGEVTGGKVEDGQHELLYDRPVSAYFDVQAGLRSDIDAAPNRNWAAFGIQGLAPNFFEVSATAYVRGSGHYAAKLEGSYELLLTQRLILEPRIEANFYSKTDSERAIGSGLSDVDAGLRLRYEFSRKFAPYIGFTYANKFGGTGDFARADGEHPNSRRLVAGVRVWL